MSEEQLRDVLARVVPEPPDSVADPAPVVRAARVRRRAQVVLAGGAVAVIAVAAVVGGRALSDDSAPQVAEEPSISTDPYSAAPCPDAAALPSNGPFPDGIVAVRYCAVPFNGFPAAPGPPDALVEDLGSFTDVVSAIPDADPARCAAVDVLPSDSRLLLVLADGTTAAVPTGMCQDVSVGGRTVDAGEVTQAFLGALDRQRSGFGYTSDAFEAVTCETPATIGLATPGRELLVEAVVCPPEAGGAGTPVDDAGVRRLDGAWSAAEVVADSDLCVAPGPPPSSVLARTDRGDVVRLAANHCGSLDFYRDLGSSANEVPVTIDELTES
jgi:hypothetical protein